MPGQPTYNPKIHHRRSIRLKGYDYAQAGFYFITICCQDRAWMFGKVISNLRGNKGTGEHVGSPVPFRKLEPKNLMKLEPKNLMKLEPKNLMKQEPKNFRKSKMMQLNEAGKMIEKWYFELENKYPEIKCHTMIVMPNHFHCIIEIVGADLRVCPEKERVCPENERVCPDNERVCPHNERVCPDSIDDFEGRDDLGEHVGLDDHIGLPLHRVIQWFKTMTTNEYIRGVKNIGWKPFRGKLWQRNYYERIIRNEQSYQNVSKYIINNPSKLIEDKFYSK